MRNSRENDNTCRPKTKTTRRMFTFSNNDSKTLPFALVSFIDSNNDSKTLPSELVSFIDSNNDSKTLPFALVSFIDNFVLVQWVSYSNASLDGFELVTVYLGETPSARIRCKKQKKISKPYVILWPSVAEVFWEMLN